MALFALLLSSLLLMPSCDKEEMNRNPLLQSFGPSPALRGGELRFIGQNLNQVSAIIFPGLTGGTIQVTDIIVVNEREIKVVIPQDAGVGIVTLITSIGEIKTITPLTYSEPIYISKVSPLKVKAGETLTIEGDYLNLIRQVIFFDGVVVEADDFLPGQTRKKLQVTVPPEAQSGKIIVSNGEEIPIEVYSQDPVQVVLPSITSLAPGLIRPGGELTISGKDFDLVDAVKFGGEKVVTAFNLNEAQTEIRVPVPADAQDSTVILIAKSGVEVSSATTLVTVVPSEISLSSTTIRSGGMLTLTGKDMDLASAVMFGTLEAGVALQTATSLTVVVPDKASATTATLQTLSGKTVDTPAFTYVKPVIASITPETVMAGTDVTITGTNLGLIRQILFPTAQKPVLVEPVSETSLVVTVPTDATSGNVISITVNGTEVVSPVSLTVTPADIPVVTSVPDAVKPGALLVFQGTKLNLVETVMFQDGIKATSFGVRSSTLLEVYVPEDALRGLNSVELLTFAGKTVTVPVTVSGRDPITANTVMIYDFDTNSTGHAVDWDNWGGSYDAESSKANGYITLVARPGWWVIGCNHLTWPSVNPNDYVLKVDIKVTQPILITGGYEFLFRIGGQDVSSQLMVEGNYITTPANDWATITLPISGKLSNPTNTGGEVGIILNWSDAGINFSGLCFDNIRFEKIN
jgi:hypothetical protein